MGIFDFFEYSVGAWIRCLSCVVLGGALYLLHRWDPERSVKKRRGDAPYEEIPVVPEMNRSALNSLSGDGAAEPETADGKHAAVNELEQYLEDLKRHRIPDIDRV